MAPNSNPLASYKWNSVVNPKFIDHAFPVLYGEPTFGKDDEKRSQLWDLFHSSRDVNELAQQLPEGLHPDFVRSFLKAKSKPSVPAATPMDKAVEAVHRVAALDPQVLETMERSPHILNALMTHLRQSREE